MYVTNIAMAETENMQKGYYLWQQNEMKVQKHHPNPIRKCRKIEIANEWLSIQNILSTIFSSGKSLFIWSTPVTWPLCEMEQDYILTSTVDREWLRPVSQWARICYELCHWLLWSITVTLICTPLHSLITSLLFDDEPTFPFQTKQYKIFKSLWKWQFEIFIFKLKIFHTDK